MQNGRNPELPAQPRLAITTKIWPAQLLIPHVYPNPSPPHPSC
jgi:hypothetical protein